MTKFVPLEKRSKKAQKEHYAKQRGSWNGVNPVSRSVPSGKLYDRKKEKRELSCRSREAHFPFVA